MAEKFNIRNIL